ncbi:hypothetical protein [Couchioplanes caeruleus]|uniref:Uncharacterized protein n=2 Tax=Couchioplanes caeruleus TaxID=56438 RepID=A0A1K0FFT8_9ACTN|nr:hypothetical protein [Couchioplanes caeruleus]OJF11677.1 hypothetical protein BG844_24940 [Couchioplanes caeruleus subsp. caeruleus]ROP27434.1 hypothetical protein EDD30_0105 [Couchioplanes caeruleus]
MTERRVDVLVVRWYERHRGAPAIVPRWLEAAREHLPEAVPRRFGHTEPLRGRFDRVGDEGLARAYGEADTLLGLDGTPPVYHASFGAAGALPRGPVQSHTLDAVLGADDERVRRFALALTHPGTVYVSASIARGKILDGAMLVGPAERPEEPYLAPMGDWLGLPPRPPEWCWFGPAYTRLVRRQVEGREVAGGLLRTGGPWARESLHARLSEIDPERKHAPRTPRGLRRSALRFMLDAAR